MRCVFALMLILLCATAAQAQEIRGGILAHDVAPLWGNERVERGVDINAEAIFGKGVIRPNIGVAFNSRGGTSRAYTGITIGTAYHGVFADCGLGFAALVNAQRKLGSAVLFRIAAEMGYRWGKHSISLMLDHVSNAGLADHNAGLDVLGVRYGWRF